MADISISIGDRNDVIILNEYKGEFSIISGYEGRDGNHYFNMVFPRDNKTKEPRDIAIPQKVKLGDRNTAKGVLRQLLATFDKPQADTVSNKVKDEDEEPPF